MHTIELTLKGRIFSKKNSKRWIVRGGRRFLVPSLGYEQFGIAAGLLLREQMPRGYKPIDYPVYVETHIHVKGSLRADGDNLHTSILDILQNAQILENDNLVGRGLYTIENGAKEWVTYIYIHPLKEGKT